jgi:hypothetical protein
LAALRLLGETYYSFSAADYDKLFSDELEKLIRRVHDPAHRRIMERMRGFNWVSYIGASVRHAGFRDQREVRERIHEVVVKLLMGKLFTGFDERTSGPMDLRFKRSVANAIRNLVEKDKNRRRYLPTIPISHEFRPGTVTADELPARSWDSGDDNDERIVNDFRELVRKRLGRLAVAVFDTRLAGGETKSLVGLPALGSPGTWTVKQIVREIKSLAREYAVMVGDSELLRRIEKAMAGEAETVEKRRAAARVGVGA